MKRILSTVVLTLGVLVFAAPAALASTVTNAITFRGATITYTITYTDSNGNGKIDTLGELRSITKIEYSISRT